MSDTETKLANAILSLVDELGQSRIIQQEMSNTLVKIHMGQQRIEDQFRHLSERQNDHVKRQGDSESKIRVVESKLARHEERTEQRLKRLEACAPDPQSAAE